MQDNIPEDLKLMYDKLRNMLISEKKLYGKSVFLSFLNKISANNRDELIQKSSVPKHELKLEVFDELLTKEFIRLSGNNNKINHYILTAKGIWFIEEASQRIKINDLLEFIDNKYFISKASRKELSGMDKIVLLSMIATRVFSNDNPMDLNDSHNLADWQEILLKALDFLSKWKLVEKTSEFKKQLTTQKGNEHPIRSLMRHRNDMPQITHQIYRYTGYRGYYLQVDLDNDEGLKKLTHLFSLFVKNKFTYELLQEFKEFCEKIANDYAYKVVKDTSILKPQYTIRVEESINNLVMK